MDAQDMRLDGNAIGGVLAELFGLDMTVAGMVCASCGTHDVMACLDVYVCAPGTVVRCRHCGSVVLRVVQGRDRFWLDASGLGSVEISSSRS